MSYPFSRRLAVILAAALAAWSAAPAAWAERADRSKQIVVEADQRGIFDMAKQVVTYIGNVVVTQGTMAIRAERVEMRELADGRRVATALGAGSKPATFRQKREGLNETIEGQAERIEYDDRSDVVRFVGAAMVKRVREAVPADEITGALITYDNLNEIFNVQGSAGPVAGGEGGGTSAGATGSGRVRAVFTPREDKAASAPGSSSPASAAASAPR